MKKEKIETANKILETILQSLDEHMYGDVPADYHNLQALITQVEQVQKMLLNEGQTE
jgi:hypothetical protein